MAFLDQFGEWLDPEGAEERKREQQEAERAAGRQSRGRAAFNAAGGNPFIGASGFHQWSQNAMAPAMSAHAGAAQQINSAIDQEMKSRVSQGRELRRMEHEKELERMRMMAQQQDQEGEIIRALLNG